MQDPYNSKEKAAKKNKKLESENEIISTRCNGKLRQCRLSAQASALKILLKGSTDRPALVLLIFEGHQLALDSQNPA